MKAKGIYYVFLAIFVMRAAFSALPYDSELIHWWVFNMGQTSTFQFAFWRLNLFLVETFLIAIIISTGMEQNAKERFKTVQMAWLILFIQGWYILEYCTHYTSVWVTWENLGLPGNGRSGLSSHMLTSIIFGYWGDRQSSN